MKAIIKLTQIDKNLYYFKISLVTDDIDKDNERFTSDALYKMSQLFIGKTGIIEAYGKTYRPRIFDAWVKKKHSTYILKALAYIYLNNQEDVDNFSDFLSTHNECSISCSCGTKACSICGRNQFKELCCHEKGKEYGNHRKCIHELSNIFEVYEWSFAIEPPVPYAGKYCGKCGERVLGGDE